MKNKQNPAPTRKSRRKYEFKEAWSSGVNGFASPSLVSRSTNCFKIGYGIRRSSSPVAALMQLRKMLNSIKVDAVILDCLAISRCLLYDE